MASRTAQQQRGDRAEAIAAAFLIARGLKIVERNLRVGRLEIDLVARDGPVVVLVEVRTRGAASWERAFDSIDARKRARLLAASERLWRERYVNDAAVERIRFDAVAVALDVDPPRVEHIRAFLSG